MKKHIRRKVSAVVSPVVISLLKLHTSVTGQQRARTVVVNQHGQILLLRGFISNGWSLPGGGIEKQETPEQAAVRELYEETGIRLTVADITPVAVLKKPDVAVNYVAHIFAAEVEERALPKVMHNVREVIELEWFNPEELPASTTPLTHASVALVSKTLNVCYTKL